MPSISYDRHNQSELGIVTGVFPASDRLIRWPDTYTVKGEVYCSPSGGINVRLTSISGQTTGNTTKLDSQDPTHQEMFRHMRQAMTQYLVNDPSRLFLTALRDRCTVLCNRLMSGTFYDDFDKRRDASVARKQDSTELASMFMVIDRYGCSSAGGDLRLPAPWRKPARRTVAADPQRIRNFANQAANACKGMRGAIYETLVRDAEGLVAAVDGGEIAQQGL